MAKIDKVQEVSVEKLRPYEKNAKIHDEDQVRKIADSIQEFGFLNPCLIDKEFRIIAGHGRVMAAKTLGMKTVPCVYVEGLTDAQRRAYILADNRLTEIGGWDDEVLQDELRQLYEEGFDINLTGFELDLGGELEASEPEAEMNPTQVLPDSRVLVCSISVFGTDAERFIEVALSQEEADNLLKKAQELQAGEIAAKLREAFGEL